MGELADRYAQAFLEAGGDGAELERCARRLEKESVLWEALCSPAVSPEEKGRVLARLPEVAPPGPAGRLLTLMAEKDRLPREGGALGTVTCARPLTEDQLGRLKETLCRLHRLKKVELEMRVDPALLGGLRLELQGVTYDKSVRGGLDALARTLGEGRAL